jgi:hypothetical protein
VIELSRAPSLSLAQPAAHTTRANAAPAASPHREGDAHHKATDASTAATDLIVCVVGLHPGAATVCSHMQSLTKLYLLRPLTLSDAARFRLLPAAARDAARLDALHARTMRAFTLVPAATHASPPPPPLLHHCSREYQ